MCESSSTNHAVIDEVSANNDTVHELIEEEAGEWAIVGLANPVSLSGSGYGWNVNLQDNNWSDMGHYLCFTEG